MSNQLLDDVKGQWVECGPGTVGDFSAAGYYFARKVQKETGYPVGMISTTWGATASQAWTRIEFLENSDNFSPTIDNFNERMEKLRKAKEAGKPKPRGFNALPFNKPAAIYNAMVAPITNMTIKGVIWYQGESNAGSAYLYRDLFPEMIKNWRCDFNNFDMPFYFVQIASLTKHAPGEEVKVYDGPPREHHWPELREAQLMTTDM